MLVDLLDVTLQFRGNVHVQRLSLNALVTFLTTIEAPGLARSRPLTRPSRLSPARAFRRPAG